MALTKKQRRLRTEIEEIADVIGMDHWKIEAYTPDTRTVFLELIRNKLVRSEIIIKYTLIDELLSVIICHFYFKKPDKEFSFRKLWKTKRFRIFNHHILEELYLLNKLRLVRAIREVPKEIRDNIERVNAVRNAVAHSFFPENRRQYLALKKVVYRGIDIFTKQGIERFEEDFETIREYLHQRAFGPR